MHMKQNKPQYRPARIFTVAEDGFFGMYYEPSENRFPWMTMPVKLRIICCVTVMMGFGFFMMARKQIWIPCMILAAVWLAHVVWFGFFVKTIEE